MNARFVVTGTDTGIGKTHFSAALVKALDGVYWKPVQSGLDAPTDTETVATLSGLPAERFLPEAYRLKTPASPHFAAEIDGVEIDLDRLSLPETPPGHPLVIEGAGGALVPLDRKTLYADLFARWGVPVILCARTGLGTINHSLLSIEALRARGVPIFGIAFIGEANPDNEATIAQFSGVKKLGRLGWLERPDAPSLASAFAAGFRLNDFKATDPGR